MNTILSLPHISPLGFCLTPNTFQSNDSAEGNFKQLELQQTATRCPMFGCFCQSFFPRKLPLHIRKVNMEFCSQEAAAACQKGKYGVLQRF